METMGQPAVRPDRIMQMAWGYAPPLIIETAVRNRVFDLLDEGPKTVEQVADLSGASVRGLRAIMNALTGFQLLSKDAGGRYATTPESSTFLVKSKPSFMGGIIEHTSTQLIPGWLALSNVVRTGKPEHGVNEENTGSEFFQQFVEAIFPMSYAAASRLADVLDVASATQPVRVLDLAAGSGVWSIALAQRSPQVSVTAVDWPGVLEVTRRVATRFGVAGRYTFVAGDLATADFGTGHNIAVLGHILHSEGERRSRELLRKTFRALAPGGTIAIQEFLVDEERSTNTMGLIFAVNMLTMTQEGDTFSFTEIAGWLRDAGFENPRTVESPGPSPLILADRPRG
ncbi:MAG TPA: class I SAM-dependent methyltransferase [Candidatus Limnocylindrales bacterium]|nr:class I SAM-dependent methyltransferase [Candidatus Limnocylindrales bacterium]